MLKKNEIDFYGSLAVKKNRINFRALDVKLSVHIKN